MLPSDMNLQIGKVKNYNNKILISLPGFKIGINLKINLDEGKPEVKPKKESDIKSNKEQKRDARLDTEYNKEHKLDIKMIKTKPDMNKITYEEEKVALVLG